MRRLAGSTIVVLSVAAACQQTGGRLEVGPLHPSIRRGFCYAHSYEDAGTSGYGTATSRASKVELRQLGTEWLSLTPFGFVPTKTSTTVMLIDEMMKTARAQAYFERAHALPETDRIVKAEIAQAHELGMKIQLKPHLWMLDESWRGEIDPGPQGWPEFWHGYRQFILHYADMAQALAVEMLVVGVELDQTVVPLADRWRALIREVRGRYDGQLVYAANWDAYERVPFWPQLDFIGVQFYPPLARSADEPSQSMVARLDVAFGALERTAREHDKDVLLTEVGYRAVRGTAVNPHEWPDPDARTIDVEAQAEAYRVLLAGVRKQPFVKGIFLWKWYTHPRGDEGPAGFSPRNKPAADLIRQAFARP